MEKRIFGALVSVLLLTVSMLASTVSAAVLVSSSYTPYTLVSGIIEQDRFDFISADGNPLGEDIANAVFQGPGVFQYLKEPEERGGVSIYDDSVGFMKDIYLSITKYGTLNKMNYTGEQSRPYHWLPVIEQDAVGTPYGVKAPVEGWLIAYNLTVFPTTFPADKGYLVVTFSGYQGGTLTPNVIGKDSDDNWALTINKSEVWIDNPRLLAIYWEIIAVNNGSPYKPQFMLQLVVVFNKATKFVEIFQNLQLLSIDIYGCQTVSFNMALGRMAIFDANPYCDRAFYGWKNVTIDDPEFFLVLSYTNKTLSKWVRADLGYDYYGAYMASYPVPDSWAIASTWYDSNDTATVPDAADVWHAEQLRYTPLKLQVGTQTPTAAYLDKYVFLHMGDIDGDSKGDGDQALTRVEWYKDAKNYLPENLTGLSTGWKMVMYGVYDVDEKYDGGEGGRFQYGYLCLSNGNAYEDDLISSPKDYKIVPVGITPGGILGVPPDPWVHTGTLGWLNEDVDDETLTSNEGMLEKFVIYLDIDQDGNADDAENNDGDGVTADDEYEIPFEWWPTEELYWQLTYKFAPPVFKKAPPTTCCMFRCSYGVPLIDNAQVDAANTEESTDDPDGKLRWQNSFMVLPAPGATPDAAGAAWLNARFTSMLVTFDVEAYNMVATVGYINPGTKMLPYLMLRLEPIPAEGVEDYVARRAHYLTSDGRALPQMEWEYIFFDTPWMDKHYMVITVAGVHPNLATYYFNDFTPIVRAIGGDYQWDIVVLPTVGPIDISPYVGTELGKGVIALAKDHFNNIALIVYGLDAQDTYWTAFFATTHWQYIEDEGGFGNAQAILMTIDYTETGPHWGIPDEGIPTAHPSWRYLYMDNWLEAVAIEWWSCTGEEWD